MSLLSTPTGRPERVFTLLSVVRSLGGRVAASDAKKWLAPQYRFADVAPATDVERVARAGDRVREVFRVAKDLNVLAAEKDDWVATGTLPATRRDFARLVHSHLCGLSAGEPDAVLLRAYAWCAAYIEGSGTAAFVSMTAKDLARDIAAGLGRKSDGEDERSFNTTKLSAWKDWMSFLGLGWNDLPGTTGFLPDPSRRIEEELATLISSNSQAEAEEFMAAVTRSFPYLDGGTLFEEACTAVSVRPPHGRLSRILSQALRALDANGILNCKMLGDSTKAIQLFPDPLSSINAFTHVERTSEVDHV